MNITLTNLQYKDMWNSIGEISKTGEPIPFDLNWAININAGRIEPIIKEYNASISNALSEYSNGNEFVVPQDKMEEVNKLIDKIEKKETTVNLEVVKKEEINMSLPFSTLRGLLPIIRENEDATNGDQSRTEN